MIRGNEEMSVVGEQSDVSPTTESRGHVLMTLLGTNPRPTCYVLDEHRVDARLAPVALFELLPENDRPNRVLALCTLEAERETWPLLQEDLGGTACSVEHVIVPSGHTQQDVNEYLVRVCDLVSDQVFRGEPVELTVDITHGFRHFSFLTYTAVLYLQAHGIARVRGAYYGLLAEDRPSPFLDLRPLLALPQWVYALSVLRDTGSAMPMAEALRVGSQHPSAQQIAKSLKDVSGAYLSGLPLELGRYASDILDKQMKPLRKRLVDDHRLPLTDELIDRLRDTLTISAFPQPIVGQGWKAKIVLSKEELERQAKIVDHLFNSGNVATAIGLMREWTVSWTVWSLNEQTEWLDFRTARRKAENLLQAIRAIRKFHESPELKAVLNPDQNKLGELWHNLITLRNAYAHHGISRQDMLDPKEKKRRHRIEEVWSELRSFPDWSLTLEGSGGRVLVSPIGLRSGVLFSALEVCREAGNGAEPSVCVVICSQDTETSIEDVATEAGYTGRIERLRIDPHGSRSDIAEAVKIGRKHIVGADDVFVNVTGGTTVMGLAVEALAVEARRFARPVCRFGLIDRRPPAQQDADPYQVGEPFWLDSEKDDDGCGD
ncbi:MAG: TM1812 family CRISPR-associated protein [Acidimicrobiaceae bacterium]|nr:TM1812 family CRISPR-associated protein [Acidimicrobiaceae bacterium]